MTLDSLGQQFEDELCPSKIEVVEEFGGIINDLEAESLIESSGAHGLLFRLTAEGRKRVNGVKE